LRRLEEIVVAAILIIDVDLSDNESQRLGPARAQLTRPDGSETV
jgi:hypothetical protein